jgi:hypothetical protein
VVQDVAFLPPLNTLLDGSCCNSSCGVDEVCCAAATCSPSLRLCFRESQYPRSDISNCPLLEVDRTNAATFLVLGIDNFPVERYYTVSTEEVDAPALIVHAGYIQIKGLVHTVCTCA